jgi:subtilase family serine protease
MGANAISNSYGGGEFSGEASYENAYYNHPGIAVTVSSGDSGYGVQFPASSRRVVAVGGTSLRTAANSRGWTENAWSGAGSGCSRFITKPTWQTDTGCARRTVADVSAVADPNTGVAVYDSYGSSGGANWFVFGGTSVAAPIIAGVYGLAHNSSSTDYPVRFAYANRTALFDVTSGSNGNCPARNAYFCRAVAGYDGPTGLGTPNGIGGF